MNYIDTLGRAKKFLKEYYKNNYLNKEGAVINSQHLCPCCYLPNLSERNNYEICSFCGWEDDGQDDHNADEVFGGPNNDYSLTEGRVNFKRHGTMYRGSDKSQFIENDKKLNQINKLIELYYDFAHNQNTENKQNILNQIQEAEESILTPEE